MSSVNIQTFANIRNIIGKKQFQIQAQTIQDLLYQLFKKYGEILKSELLDAEGNIKLNYHIIVNGRNINLLDGLETELKEGDTVVIIPAIAGG